MPDITMEDFLDDCLTIKKKRKKIIEEKPTNVSSIFEADQEEDDSIVNTKKAKSKEKEKNLKPEVEKTEQEDLVLSIVLNINGEKKVKKINKQDFLNDLPLNFQSILKRFDLDLDQISQKAAKAAPAVEEISIKQNKLNEAPVLDQIPTEPPAELGEEPPAELGKKPDLEDFESDKKPEKEKYDKFRLLVKEYITSGNGSEKVELSWRREGEGESAIETAEVVTSNGSIPFNDSPDPLNAAITTFDRIYYNDLISKIRQELDYEETSE